MKLIGQEEVWENIKKANAIARAWAWFQGALDGLLGFVRADPGDVRRRPAVAGARRHRPRCRAPSRKVIRVVRRASPARFLSWAGSQVLSLLQIIFEVLAPAVMPYLRKAMGALQDDHRATRSASSATSSGPASRASSSSPATS